MDLIDRQAAIAYAVSGRTREFESEKWIRVSEVRASLQTMPSAQPEHATCYLDSPCEYQNPGIKIPMPTVEPYNWDEWCEDCKEYDHARHCCPRFNRVIRTAMEEAKGEDNAT